MTHLGVALALALVTLHRADGHPVHVNPHEVISITPARGGHGHFAPGVHCVVHTSDRKFISVRETCATAYQLLEDGKQ